MRLRVFQSEDGRLRTDFYTVEGTREFVVAEKTAKGVLLTKFNGYGEVLDQLYKRPGDALVELRGYVEAVDTMLNVENVPDYRMVEVSARCENCNGTEIRRELDLAEPSFIERVPVVPIFICRKCSKRFYSMTGMHLSNIVSRNLDLFESEELKMKGHDEKEFLRVLEEYVIRIFASKRITKMKIEK